VVAFMGAILANTDEPAPAKKKAPSTKTFVHAAWQQ
jgi:hypothetical protein